MTKPITLIPKLHAHTVYQEIYFEIKHRAGTGPGTWNRDKNAN